MPPNRRLLRQVVDKIQANGMDIDWAADQLGQVIRGETIKDKFVVTEKDGRTIMRHTERQVTSKPADRAAGLRVWDALTGGQLGLAPQDISPGTQAREAYRRFLPAEDNRILWGDDSGEEAPQDAEPDLQSAQVALDIIESSDEDDVPR